VHACGVNYIACTIFAFKNRSYLGEFEAEFKKGLARESGALGVLFDEKNEGRNSSDTVPLRFLYCISNYNIQPSGGQSSSKVIDNQVLCIGLLALQVPVGEGVTKGAALLTPLSLPPYSP
jgi:hypothetical protein